MVTRYVLKFLTEEGITLGEIGPGARLAEDFEMYEWDTMSLFSIFDILAELTSDSWFIDMEGRLHFATSYALPAIHTEEFMEIREDNHNFWDFEAEKTLEDYINKVFIAGGDPSEEIPEEFLNYDGNIKYVEENLAEIERLRLLNRDSGVWGKVVHNESIEYLQNAKELANIEMRKHGKMKTTINVKTELDIFKPTDRVFAEAVSCNVKRELYTVASVEITFDNAGELTYELELTNNEIIKKNHFTDVVVDILKPNKKDEKPKPDISEKDFISKNQELSAKLLYWVDLQDESTLDVVSVTSGGEYQDEKLYKIIKDGTPGTELFYRQRTAEVIKEIRDVRTGIPIFIGKNIESYSVSQVVPPEIRNFMGFNFLTPYSISDTLRNFSRHPYYVHLLDTQRTAYTRDEFNTIEYQFTENIYNTKGNVFFNNENDYLNGRHTFVVSLDSISEANNIYDVIDADIIEGIKIENHWEFDRPSVGSYTSLSEGAILMTGDLYTEVITFNERLSETATIEVTNYLKNKYKVILPQEEI